MRLRLDGSSINDIGDVKYNDDIVCGGNKLWRINTDTYDIDIIDHQTVKCLDTINERVISGNTNIVKLWDINQSNQLLTFNVINNGVNDHINDVKFINHRLFITGGYNSTVNMFDARVRHSIYDIKVCKDNIIHMEIYDDNIFISTSDQQVIMINLKSDRLLHHQFKFIIINFKIYHDYLIGLTDKGDILIYNYKQGTVVNLYNITHTINFLISLDIIANDYTISIFIGSQQSKIIKLDWQRSTNLIVNKLEYVVDSEIVTKVITKLAKLLGVANDGYLYILNREIFT